MLHRLILWPSPIDSISSSGGKSMNIYFEMPAYASPALRARLGYAFRLFCAVYGHRPILDAADAASGEVAIRYRDSAACASIADARTVWLCRGLRDRDPRHPAPPPIKYTHDGLSTLLHYSLERSKAPDWLGEIFEWVSCADEYSVTERDSIGRPVFEATYAGRHGIDVRTPYAALAMRGLQQEICRVAPRASEHPLPPEGLDGHAVLPTHDVDYFPMGRVHAAYRLVRNAVISCVLARRPALGLRQAGYAARLLLGSDSDPLDQLVHVAEEELRQGFSSSYYFLVRNAHRLDAGYTLADAGVLEMMRWLEARGMEVGLHGSFTSLEEPGLLADERRSLEAESVRTVGGRQHWLRYTLDRLLPSVESAGLQYDASIGWSRHIGFRAGACFAFPPYDFAKEGPAAFLEFPLVVMDQALDSPAGRKVPLFHEVTQMISTSRRLGWGGISLLWHPAAFGDGWLATEVGDMYWRLAEDRRRWNDLWLKASQFFEIARPRYVEAGLLPVEAPSAVAQQYPFTTFAGERNGTSATPVPLTGNAMRA
jgi:hypothetical protein